MQMVLKDAYNMQYISNFQVAAGDWAPVTIAVSSFIKDPYYTPSDAVTGHPMDLSKTTGMNLASHIVGAAVIEVGPVSTDKGGGAANASAGASAASAPAAAAPAVSNGSAVVVSDFSTDDPKTYGTFQDSNGSSYVVSFKTGPKKKYLFVTYNYVNGGYCGMWCRAGQTWDGISLVGAKNLTLTVFSKDPVVLGLALKDKNNNQYVAEAPSTKGGGKWENITVSLDSFKLDPYYTPPDAVKGAAQDFSLVKTFNIQPKTVGKFVFAVDKVVAK
jgi:hypothetical protein